MDLSSWAYPFIIAETVSTIFLEIFRLRISKWKIVFYQKREYTLNNAATMHLIYVIADIAVI